MDARLSRTLAATLVVTAWLTPASARALELRADGDLGPIDRVRLDELLRLELRDRPEVAVVEIAIAGGSARVVVVLEEGRRRPERVIPVDGDGDVERAIALFVGEIARQPDEPSAEGRASPPPAAPPPTPTPAPRVPAVDAALERRTRAPHRVLLSGSAELSARWFPRDGLALPTVAAGASVALARSVDVTIHAQYGYASRGDALGRVHGHATGVVACALLKPPRAEGAMFAVGPCASGGALVGVGSGEGARTVAHPYGTAHLRAEARTGAMGATRLLAAVDLGAMAGGLDLRADDRPVMAMRGLWLSLAVGARLP